jgi:hypothetical protein
MLSGTHNKIGKIKKEAKLVKNLSFIWGTAPKNQGVRYSSRS